MKRLVLIVPLIIAFACQDAGVSPDNPPNLRTLSAAEVQVSKSTNDFAFNLFRNLPTPETDNAFISPLSVSMALGMVLNGAEGEVRQSILNTIDFKEYTAEEVNEGFRDLTKLLLSMDRKINFGLANSVWYRNDLTVNAQFSSTIKNYYDGIVKDLDFANPASKDIINSWLESKTNNRIKDLINQIKSDEVMFLVNVIYFKGDWTHQFDKSKTKKAPFTTLSGAPAQVDMMFSKGVSMKYKSTPDFQLLDIPYGNSQFRFTILMPHEYSGILDLTETINAQTFNNTLNAADSISVELELPKFKMTWKDDLKPSLAQMGMLMVGFPLLFEGPTPPIQVGRVIHQSFLEVNEEGSEAAAATAIGMEFTSVAPSKPTKITIDKPFLFMIREKHSGVILFIGQLTDPGAL
ncbi:MAG TPA: serpin family protein [Cyclobacteriaceae bacterium]|nr:serpin family protein [Cyclobacteriaceae bacterium]HRJ83099.1 serpin family protein [Cyclobacteriaceae bacterium]